MYCQCHCLCDRKSSTGVFCWVCHLRALREVGCGYLREQLRMDL